MWNLPHCLRYSGASKNANQSINHLSLIWRLSFELSFKKKILFSYHATLTNNILQFNISTNFASLIWNEKFISFYQLENMLTVAKESTTKWETDTNLLSSKKKLKNLGFKLLRVVKNVLLRFILCWNNITSASRSIESPFSFPNWIPGLIFFVWLTIKVSNGISSKFGSKVI